MEFTTPQIYGIFAALGCAAIAGFIFYCIGLRTGKAAGYEQGRTTGKHYWKKIVAGIRADLAEARDQLDIRTRDTASLRESMQHLERDLLQRLGAAAPLTPEDQAVLLAVTDKLMLAASTFDSLNSPCHARTTRHPMPQVLDMTERLRNAADNKKPHPDSELIDWLEANAGIGLDFQTANLYFDCDPASLNPVTNSLRQIVRLAIQQAEEEAAADANREDAA